MLQFCEGGTILNASHHKWKVLTDDAMAFLAVEIGQVFLLLVIVYSNS